VQNVYGICHEALLLQGFVTKTPERERSRGLVDLKDTTFSRLEWNDVISSGDLRRQAS